MESSTSMKKAKGAEMSNMSDINGQALKYAADGLSIGVLAGTLANILPSIAAGMTILWTAIRIWETDTVQRLLGRRGGKG